MSISFQNSGPGLIFTDEDGTIWSFTLGSGSRLEQTYNDWIAAGNTVLPDPATSISAIRDRKWDDIKNQRDTRKAGGVFVDSYWIHTDDSSRIQWIGLKDTARDNITSGAKMTDFITLLGSTVIWKTLSGSYVPVTNQLAFDVVQATKNLDAILFATAEKMRQTVNAIPTPDQFDTTTGWPLTFTEQTGLQAVTS